MFSNKRSGKNTQISSVGGGPVLLNVSKLKDERGGSVKKPSAFAGFNVMAQFRSTSKKDNLKVGKQSSNNQNSSSRSKSKISPIIEIDNTEVVQVASVKDLERLGSVISYNDDNNHHLGELQIIEENSEETEFKTDLQKDCYVDVHALRRKTLRQREDLESSVMSTTAAETRVPISSTTAEDDRRDYEAEKNEDFDKTGMRSGSEDPLSITMHKPHKRSWTESPFLCCLSPCLPNYYKLRGHLLHNSFFDHRIKIPFIQSLSRRFTVGELIILLIIFGLTTAFCVLSFAHTYGMKLTGILTGIPLILCIALGTRNSIFTFLLGIPFERQLFWHKVFCFITLLFTWIHGLVSYLGYQDDGTVNPVNSCGPEGTRDCSSGWSFGAVLTAFPLLSIWFIRRKFYSIFKIIHVVLLLTAFGLGCYHFFQIGIVIAALLWGMDLIIRYVYLVLVHAPYKCEASHLPSNIIRLTFPNPKQGKLRFKYSAGQYVFIMIPQLNPFEWHPFSLSSSPHDDFVSIHIRVLGDWTGRLQRHLKSLVTRHDRTVQIKAFFEGPYGAPEIDIESDKYKLFLLISGGIGITPMQSIANSLNHQKKGGRNLKKVMFIWTCGDKFMVNQVLMDRRDHTKWWNSHHHGHEDTPMEFELDNMPVLSLDPDLLERRTIWKQKQLESKVVLHTEFYLTRSSGSRMHSVRKARIRPDLESCIKFSRPDWDKIFETMKTYAWAAEEPRVAVMACGPEKLVQEARRLCGEKSDWKVSFDFHAESFDF